MCGKQDTYHFKVPLFSLTCEQNKMRTAPLRTAPVTDADVIPSGLIEPEPDSSFRYIYI